MVCSGPCYLSQGLECSWYLKKSVKVRESVKEQVAHEEATVSCCTLSSLRGAPVACKGQQVRAKGFSRLDVYTRGGGGDVYQAMKLARLRSKCSAFRNENGILWSICRSILRMILWH